MLSPTGKGPTDALVDSAYRALREAPTERPPEWPTEGSELVWYPPLATFLNNCVGACRGALDGSKSATANDPRSRLYDHLKFIVYDRTTVDGVEGASQVKPDLVGGLDLESTDRVAWAPQDSHTKRVLFPVEVEGGWGQLVSQAATYARCLFSASPSRQFAVVLGFQHRDGELRFLVFHRGGLTGSKHLSVKGESGQRDILRILLSILNWRSAKDAGFPEFYNELEMRLLRHEDDQVGVVASVLEVLHDDLCVQGRASRVLRMGYPTSEGKEPDHPISAPGPAFRTRGRARIETKQTRMPFHH